MLSPADSKAVVHIRCWEPLYGLCVWERKEVDILRQRVWCRKVRGWRRWPIFAIVGSVVLAPKVVWRRQVFDAALARGDWLDKDGQLQRDH